MLSIGFFRVFHFDEEVYVCKKDFSHRHVLKSITCTSQGILYLHHWVLILDNTSTDILHDSQMSYMSILCIYNFPSKEENVSLTCDLKDWYLMLKTVGINYAFLVNSRMIQANDCRYDGEWQPLIIS